MVIYKLENMLTEQLYIGKTVQSLQKRLKGHERTAEQESNSKLSNSIRKYGIEAFKIEVLEEVLLPDILNEREVYWIEKYDTYNNGLNSTKGGDGGDNSQYIDYSNRKYMYTEELKEKRRQQLLANNPNYMPGVRDKISKALRGRKKTEEWISKIHESRKDNGFSWKGKNNPNYVEVTGEQLKVILENKDKVRYKKELVEMTGLSYFMINKILKTL